MALADLALAEFVAAVGRDRPTPGCGGAAAAALALAAACAAKAFAISGRRLEDEALSGAAERCRSLAEAALEGIQRDAAHFRELLTAETADDGPARALEEDARRLGAVAEALKALIGRWAGQVDADLQGDVDAALALAEAFERIQARNLAELAPGD